MPQFPRKLSHQLPGTPDIIRNVLAGEPQAHNSLLEIMGKRDNDVLTPGRATAPREGALTPARGHIDIRSQGPLKELIRPGVIRGASL